MKLAYPDHIDEINQQLEVMYGVIIESMTSVESEYFVGTKRLCN